MAARSLPIDPRSDDRTPALVEPFFHDVVSADGTVLQAWTNDPDCLIDGPVVLLCNGLGTNAWTMPALLRPDCGLRVISWNHRGVGGSERPADPDHVGVDSFVEDAVAVMDASGVESAVVMGWSIGVNTMFQLAADHPERVKGLFALAGVPGDTFSTMLEFLHLPRPVARALTVNVSRAVSSLGCLLTPVARRLPMGPASLAVLGHTGFMFPPADPETASRALREFLQTPIDWYFHLAVRTSLHGRVSLSAIDRPAMFVAGSWDVLAGPKAMRSAAERMRDATYVELQGSHFIAMEKPDTVHALLMEFLERID
ncbi:alpha/beta fold hydrolase [Nocardioides daejeonensis]|uniref:alpha/beta fold hydrolase n=1 Tax=Nocardioides daejeonensis TaxID=1046556 RepID=UPI000D7477A7|nr:alpha/beta hydrolase [Nocardioides daejeonensis]